MKAVVVSELGGPENLRLQEVPDPKPGVGELLVDVSAAGVNFMDTGARRLGPTYATVPFIPGVEGAGIVRAIGEDVVEFNVGDRVAWVYAWGSYAEQVLLPAAAAVRIPDAIPSEVAAALMMQGITAHHFITVAGSVSPGQTVLIHAAAGGLGQLLTQLAKWRGARVIALVSRAEKIEVARAVGADEVLLGSGDQFAYRVVELTDGVGADIVFDGNGEPTFWESVRSTRRNGTMLYYGPLIGEAPRLRVPDIPNSIKLCYPVFRDHMATRADLVAHVGELFQLVQSGDLIVRPPRRYGLYDAARAHFDIESRATTGKLLLIPGTGGRL